MAYDTRELAVKITGDASGFSKATGQVTKQTDKANSSFQQFSAGARKASLVLAGVGAGLTAYAKNATDYTVSLAKGSKELSRETGSSIEQSSRLIYVAERMGVSTDQASQVFGIFSKKIQSATEDTKKAVQAHAELQNKIDQTKSEITKTTAEISKNGDKTGELTLKVRTLKTNLTGLQGQLSASQNSFQKLGISVTDSSGKTKSFNTLLLETADKFQQMKDGTEKTTIAMDLFGRAGKDMIPLLNKGSQGIQQLESDADKLGLTLTTKSVDSIAKYVKAQKDLKDSTNALKIQVGLLTTPALTSFDNHVNGITHRLLAMHGPMHTLTVDTLAFGGPIAGAASGLLGFLGNLDQAIPALKGFTALLGNPYVLALIGAVAATGTLITVYKHLTDQFGASGSVFDETQDKLTGANARFRSSVTFLKLAQTEQKDAENNVTKAISDHKAALAAIKPAQDGAKQDALAVAKAQGDVTTALNKFGANSPQYKKATDILASAEYNYNQKLLSNWGLQVNVKTAADNLATARSNLANKTADLNRLEGILKNGLDSGLKVVAKFGPTAAAQVKGIDLLQSHLSTVVKTFNGFDGNIQKQVPKINEQLGGISKALQVYQGQSTKLNDSLRGGGGGSTLQGGTSRIPHNASGTDNWKGGITWVGEKGPEIVNLPKGSKITPNSKSVSPSISLTANIGMYAGMPVEKRQIALELYKELVRAARSQGVALPMIGAVGVQ